MVPFSAIRCCPPKTRSSSTRPHLLSHKYSRRSDAPTVRSQGFSGNCLFQPFHHWQKDLRPLSHLQAHAPHSADLESRDPHRALRNFKTRHFFTWKSRFMPNGTSFPKNSVLSPLLFPAQNDAAHKIHYSSADTFSAQHREALRDRAQRLH